MWIFYSAVQKALDLKRTCPHCKRSQLVKLKYRGLPAPCNSCGKKIPPPKAFERS